MKLSEVDPNSLDDKLIKRIFYSIKKEEYESADYIIIYGCHIKQLLDERLIHALNILKDHEVSKIILTGGIGKNGDFNEAEYMKNYLINNSIAEDKIIIENKSTTTEENNINIMNILKLKETSIPTNIVLITQELHLIRIILHWSKLLNNDNIHFYYDYVDNSVLSVDNVLKNENLIRLLKDQVIKTQTFISKGEYIDIEI